jgi:hypothetical protein
VHAVTLRGLLLVVPIVLGGCFLMPWSPERPASGVISGPVVDAEGCQTCHAAGAGQRYAESLHAAMGIHCGQCHVPGNHPDFTEPVRDGKCGGCHLPQFEQTLASKHFATRIRHPLDGDRTARVALRREGFTVAASGGRRFTGDDAAGALGGRLCAACHFDEHRLGLRAVQRADFCVGCHGGREDHFPGPSGESANRCTSCHVRVGESVTGQIVDTHRFAVPGAEATTR